MSKRERPKYISKDGRYIPLFPEKTSFRGIFRTYWPLMLGYIGVGGFIAGTSMLKDANASVRAENTADAAAQITPSGDCTGVTSKDSPGAVQMRSGDGCQVEFSKATGAASVQNCAKPVVISSEKTAGQHFRFHDGAGKSGHRTMTATFPAGTGGTKECTVTVIAPLTRR